MEWESSSLLTGRPRSQPLLPTAMLFLGPLLHLRGRQTLSFARPLLLSSVDLSLKLLVRLRL